MQEQPVHFGVLRAINRSEEELSEFINSYRAASSEIECNQLVGQLLSTGAMFVGYVRKRDLTKILDRNGMPTGGKTKAGDVFQTLEQLQQNRKI